MQLLKKITILLCFLSLIAFISCSAEDKSGVKGKDNTGPVGVGTGEGIGTDKVNGKSESTEAGGGSGTEANGGTETTTIGNFPPPIPNGTYKETAEDMSEVQVKVLNNADISGRLVNQELKKYTLIGFNVPKWKKTTKDGKDKLESVDATNVDGWSYTHTNINIVYYYDSSTLEITFKDKNEIDWSFKGTRQPQP